MSDTSDSIILAQCSNDANFQARCKLAFIKAAISVTTEVIVANVNATTASGNPTLHFASTPAGIVAGMSIADTTTPAAIPSTATVLSTTATTVVMNVNAAALVGANDLLTFTPPSRTQRLAFAGALFADTVNKQVLAHLILSNVTISTAVLANQSTVGGNALQTDLDFQVGSVFTGVATSRSW